MPAVMVDPASQKKPTPSASGILAVGTRVGNYLIECELGRGGMGVVYRAKHVGLDKAVAIKIISVNTAGSSQAISRLKREGETLARLRHPNILAVTDCGEVNGLPYLVLDYMEGGTVEEWLHREGGKLREQDVKAVLHDVLSGLKTAHEADIIHRDIKPANLLLEADRTVRISDFGLSQAFAGSGEMTVIARTSENPSPEATVVVSSETQTSLQPPNSSTSYGTFGGTIHFMAPELHTNPRGDARSDIYAVGITAYYLLTGRKPGGKLKPASKLVPGVSSSWDGFIDKCLEQQPEDRFQTADEAQRALDKLQFGRAVAWRKPLLIAASLAVLVGALALWLHNRDGNVGTGSVNSRPLSRSVYVSGLPSGSQLRVDGVNYLPEGDGTRKVTLVTERNYIFEMFVGDEKKGDKAVFVSASEDVHIDFASNAPAPISEKVEQGEDHSPAKHEPTETPNGPVLPKPVDHVRVRLAAADGEIPLGTQVKTVDGRDLGYKDAGPLYIDLPTGSAEVQVSGPGLVSARVMLVPGANSITLLPLRWIEYTVAISHLPRGSEVTFNEKLFPPAPDGTLRCAAHHGRGLLFVRAPFRQEFKKTIEVTADTAIEPILLWDSLITVNLPDNQKIVFHQVPPGKYNVGSTLSEPGRQQSDLDSTTVVLEQPVFFGETEVTQGQYAAVMKLARRQGVSVEVNPSYNRGRNNPNLPVEQVSYKEITGKLGFIETLNLELKRQGLPFVADIPEENEWEIACRAGTATSFNNGADLVQMGTDPTLDTIAHYNKAISTGGPIVVRSKSPNAFGLFDMEGNVAEIVRHMAQSVANGAAAKQEEARVFSRGGSWKTPAEHTRSASRTEVYADRKAADIGFRVILKPVTER